MMVSIQRRLVCSSTLRDVAATEAQLSPLVIPHALILKAQKLRHSRAKEHPGCHQTLSTITMDSAIVLHLRNEARENIKFG